MPRAAVGSCLHPVMPCPALCGRFLCVRLTAVHLCPTRCQALPAPLAIFSTESRTMGTSLLEWWAIDLHATYNIKRVLIGAMCELGSAGATMAALLVGEAAACWGCRHCSATLALLIWQSPRSHRH